jgi:hypothetical protein
MTDTNPVKNGPTGMEATRFNALRHGVLSRHTVLPWEDAEEYQALAAALTAEHAPKGPTEEHLVEELAGIVWRKRRLRLAETALHRRGLYGTMESYSKTAGVALAHLHGGDGPKSVSAAVRDTPADTQEAAKDLKADEGMTHRALAVLESQRNDRYEAALEALREDTRGWWTDYLSPDAELNDDEEPYRPEAGDLKRFIERHVMPWYHCRHTELENRTLIREQAFGESLEADKLEVLARYEVHLDRKLERMLTILVRLKDLRLSREPNA